MLDDDLELAQTWAPDPSDVDVHSVAFRPDGAIEITFDEARDLTDAAVLAKTIIFKRDVLNKADYEEVLESLREWIDEGLRSIRTSRSGGG